MSEIVEVEAANELPAYTLRTNHTPDRRGFLMLHGLSGDERSMWALEPALPPVRTLLAPRGIFKSALGGYSWSEGSSSNPVSLRDFDPAVEALARLLGSLQNRSDGAATQWFLMGFSQGAACAFALACSQRAADLDPFLGLVAIAGFLPVGEYASLKALPVYWGHGLKDQLVPVSKAREAVEMLHTSGVEVDYCETDVGHKLGSECLKGLKQWYLDLDLA